MRLGPEVKSGGLLRVQVLYVTRLGVQAVGFLLLARELPARSLGFYATLTAIVLMATPWAYAGLDTVLFRLVSQQALDGRSLRSILRRCWLPNALGVAASVLATVWVTDLGIRVVVPIVTAELVVFPLTTVLAQITLAGGRQVAYASILVLPGTVRLAAVAPMAFVASDERLGTYAAAEAALAIGALVVFVLPGLVRGLRRTAQQGSGHPHPQGEIRVSAEGVSYALGMSARSVYADVDKIILTVAVSPAATATYVVAYRLISFAQAPALAVSATALRSLFQAAAKNGSQFERECREVVRRSAVAGAAGVIAMLLGTVVVLTVVLPQYGSALPYAVALSVVPFTTGLHTAFGDITSAAGRQWRRVKGQLMAACISVVAGVVLIWLLDLEIWGAVTATIISEVVLVVVTWRLAVSARASVVGRTEG